MNLPLCTIITATTGRQELYRCIESVAKQTYPNIQHLIIADGPETHAKVQNIRYQASIKGNHNVDIINLPFSIGKDRWNGHRIYGAGTYIADGDYVCFLDDDNTLEPNHIQSCFDVIPNYGIQSPTGWSYSLRKIVSLSGEYLCNDDCESLGNWASVINPQDFFVDVNC